MQWFQTQTQRFGEKGGSHLIFNYLKLLDCKAKYKPPDIRSLLRRGTQLQRKSCFCISCSKPTVCKHFPIRQHHPVEEVWLQELCHWLKGLYSNPLSFLSHTSSTFFQPSDHHFWQAGITSPRAIASVTPPPHIPSHNTPHNQQQPGVTPLHSSHLPLIHISKPLFPHKCPISKRKPKMSVRFPRHTKPKQASPLWNFVS